MLYLIIIFMLLLIIVYLCIANKHIHIKPEYTFNGNLKKYIFTYHEKIFFEQLKRITDENNCYIFPKMRIADIIETNGKNNFNKICSKHIDYTICNRSCTPIMFIELDDFTHNYKSTQERDSKKDLIFQNSNAKIYRVTPKNRDLMLYNINLYLKNLVK